MRRVNQKFPEKWLWHGSQRRGHEKAGTHVSVFLHKRAQESKWAWPLSLSQLCVDSLLWCDGSIKTKSYPLCVYWRNGFSPSLAQKTSSLLFSGACVKEFSVDWVSTTCQLMYMQGPKELLPPAGINRPQILMAGISTGKGGAHTSYSRSPWLRIPLDNVMTDIFHKGACFQRKLWSTELILATLLTKYIFLIINHSNTVLHKGKKILNS